MDMGACIHMFECDVPCKRQVLQRLNAESHTALSQSDRNSLLEDAGGSQIVPLLAHQPL